MVFGEPLPLARVWEVRCQSHSKNSLARDSKKMKMAESPNGVTEIFWRAEGQKGWCNYYCHHSLLWVHFNAVEYCNVQCDSSVDWDITIIPVIVIHPISRLPRSNPPPTRLRPVILLNPNPTIATIFSSCCLLFIG